MRPSRANNNSWFRRRFSVSCKLAVHLIQSDLFIPQGTYLLKGWPNHPKKATNRIARYRRWSPHNFANLDHPTDPPSCFWTLICFFFRIVETIFPGPAGHHGQKGPSHQTSVRESEVFAARRLVVWWCLPLVFWQLEIWEISTSVLGIARFCLIESLCDGRKSLGYVIFEKSRVCPEGVGTSHNSIFSKLFAISMIVPW